MNCCGSSSTDNCSLCLEPLSHSIYLVFKPQQCQCRWKTHIQCGIDILQKSPNCLICRKQIHWSDCVIRQPFINWLLQSLLFIGLWGVVCLRQCSLYERACRYYQTYRRTIWFGLQLNTFFVFIFYCYLFAVYSLLLANLFLMTVVIGLSGLFLFDLLFECSF